MKAKIKDWVKSLEQDGDCWSGQDQLLTIKQTDGGGGPYYVIETERWAFNDFDELIEMLAAAGVERREAAATDQTA